MTTKTLSAETSLVGEVVIYTVNMARTICGKRWKTEDWDVSLL